MKFSKELMKGSAELIVMQALKEEGEAYGYQLIKIIESSSHNIFEFREGTLYPLLYRLEQKKYISSYEKTAPSNKMRRYYTLTEKGQKVFESKTKEMGIFMDSLKNMLHMNEVML